MGGLVPATWAEIVYDNTTSSLSNNMPMLPAWRNDSAEIGYDIWLGGTAREVTQLKIWVNYRGEIPGTMDLQIRFRNLGGDPQVPTTAFYESGIITDFPTLSGMNIYTFEIPHVLVPDHFVWSVQAYHRQGSEGEIGPAYFNPPTVGSSDDFFWLSDMGSDWIAYSWGGDPVANFAARLTAVVPEPTSLTVASFGAALLLRRRRR